MSCHEREALTLHHENDPVPRGTAAGQSYNVVAFTNTSVVIFKAALLLPSLCSGEGHKARAEG
jgi:hypothetical protein